MCTAYYFRDAIPVTTAKAERLFCSFNEWRLQRGHTYKYWRPVGSCSHVGDTQRKKISLVGWFVWIKAIDGVDHGCGVDWWGTALV